MLRAAGRGRLNQNPQGGRKCGERHRREETLGNGQQEKHEQTKLDGAQGTEQGIWRGEIKVELMKEAVGQERKRVDRHKEAEQEEKHTE